MLKKLNDKLYLSLQLFNGPEGATNRVFVELRDQDNGLLSAFTEVPHISRGFFSESSKTMPSVEVVFAFFEVREADGVTISCDHGYPAQRYDRDFTGEQVQSLRPINATITGDIDNSNLVAEVANVDGIEALVEDPDLIAELNGEDVNEYIENNDITGEVQ